MNSPEQAARVVRSLAPLAVAQPDAELLRRFAAAGDGDAFAALVQRHGPMVLGVCRRVAGHAHDAEDAFQVAFLVLARKAASLHAPDALGNWLYGVAYRSALKVRAGRRREELAREELAARPRPEPDADAREAIDRAVFGLPEKYRTAVVLCELQGVARKDAAARLGLSEGTLSSRLAAARRLLARRLGGAVSLPTVVAVGADLARAATGAAARPTIARVARSVEVDMTLAKLKFPAVVAAVMVAAVGGAIAWQVPSPPPGGGGPPAADKKADATAGKPLLTLTGTDSRVTAAAHVRASDATAWQQEWLRHLGVDPKEQWTSRGPTMEVDFTTCEVVVVFRGSGTNNRGIRVVSLTEVADSVTIRYEDASFQTSGGAVAVTSYGFLLVPKTNKPIVVERNAQRIIGRPPEWKEEARLPAPRKM